ncbi:hypothetical protein HK104_005308, partial [Borealophlyctis nickersoniae]
MTSYDPAELAISALTGNPKRLLLIAQGLRDPSPFVAFTTCNFIFHLLRSDDDESFTLQSQLGDLFENVTAGANPVASSNPSDRNELIYTLTLIHYLMKDCRERIEESGNTLTPLVARRCENLVTALAVAKWDYLMVKDNIPTTIAVHLLKVLLDVTKLFRLLSARSLSVSEPTWKALKSLVERVGNHVELLSSWNRAGNPSVARKSMELISSIFACDDTPEMTHRILTFLTLYTTYLSSPSFVTWLTDSSGPDYTEFFSPEDARYDRESLKRYVEILLKSVIRANQYQSGGDRDEVLSALQAFDRAHR